MNERQIIVERSAVSGALRVGVPVGEEPGPERRVTWTDTGEQGTVRLGAGRAYLVTEGSLQHARLVDLEGLRRRLDSDPEGLFQQAMRESRNPLSPGEIRSALVDLGLNKEQVAAAWKQHARALLRTPEVEGAGKPARYVWRAQGPGAESRLASGEDVSPIAESQLDPPGPTSNPQAETQPGHSARSGQAPASRLTVDIALPLGAAGADLDEQSTEADALAADNADSTDVRAILAAALEGLDQDRVERLATTIEDSNTAAARALLAEIIGERVAGEDVPQHRHDPTLAAQFLGALDETTLKRLADVAVDRRSSRLAGMLLGVSKKSRAIEAIDAPALMGPRQVQVLIVDLIQWFERSSLSARARAQNHVAWTAMRLSKSAERTALSNPVLVRFLDMLSGTGSRDQGLRANAQEALVDLLAMGLRDPDRSGGAVEAHDLRTLARSIQGLPFNATGGRSSLLAALAVGGHAGELRDPAWWVGLEYDDLVAAGNGALGSVFALADVGDHVVQPIVSQRLSAMSNRRDLAWLFSLPPVVAQRAMVDDVAKAAWAIGTRDAWLGDLLGHLRDESGRRALEIERDEAIRQYHDSQDATQRALASLAEAEDRVSRLQARVSASHTESHGLRASNARQAKLDSLRTLAQIAVTVESSVGRLSPDQLFARVLAALGRQGIQQVGTRGQVVPFDPISHDPGLTSLGSGAPVIVTRSGYAWHDADEQLVLVKAVVMTPKDEDE